MYETVETGSNKKKVILGKDSTCPDSQYRGWGAGCKALVLKEDGLYHCEDCGLVYLKRLKSYTKMEKDLIDRPCECAVLNETIEWWFDECHGYECPASRSNCTKCGRHYETPPTAEPEQQESQAARKYVSDRIRWRQEEHAQKLSYIEDEVRDLMALLDEVSPEERQKLIAPLFS